MYQTNPNAHMCDMRRWHSQIYGFPGPFKPQCTQIWLEPLWRPYPIIRLVLKCGGITWDCCRLPEAQYYCMWHWANTETNPISVMTFLWADIMKIRPIGWTWTVEIKQGSEGNEGSLSSSYSRDLTGKRAKERVADAKWLVISHQTQRKAEDCWSIEK